MYNHPWRSSPRVSFGVFHVSVRFLPKGLSRVSLGFTQGWFGVSLRFSSGYLGFPLLQDILRDGVMFGVLACILIYTQPPRKIQS